MLEGEFVSSCSEVEDLLSGLCSGRWQDSFRTQTGQSRGGSWAKSEGRVSAAAPFKSSGVSRQQPQNSGTKRWHYKGVIILSASKSAARAAAGGVRGSALML